MVTKSDFTFHPLSQIPEACRDLAVFINEDLLPRIQALEAENKELKKKVAKQSKQKQAVPA